MTSVTAPTTIRTTAWSVVGLLVLLEVASGVLQGFYTPIYTDIARHLDIKDADVNWFEAAQLIVSAIAVPPLARLGDQIGHKTVLVGATAVTAVATWGVAAAPSFAGFLIAWAIAGLYVVWLPLEVAVVHLRAGGDAQLTRRGAALLVAALELSVIVAAGISMPHSPRWHRGRLWVLESGQGALSVVDLDSGKLETVAELPGFTRGLAMDLKLRAADREARGSRPALARRLRIAQRVTRRMALSAGAKIAQKVRTLWTQKQTLTPGSP